MGKIIEEKNLIIKEIKEDERNILGIITDLKLNCITVPYDIKNNKLIMEKGKVCDRLNLDILKLYKECLEPMYKYENKEYSPGIYAFYCCKNNNKSQKQYITYLKDEFCNIEKEYKFGLLKKLEKMYDECNVKFYKSYNLILETNIINNPFCLLHGDLFSGNILEYNNKYKLIDFEYMRFGIKELELAFLVSWDFITNKSISKYSKKIINSDVEKLTKAGYITKSQADIIINFFIPMFFMLACLYVSNKMYKDGKEITKSIISFYEEFYLK